MKVKEQILIEEVGGKTFQVRMVEPMECGRAALTHYFHNYGSDTVEYYEDEAIRYIKNNPEYLAFNEENISSITEEQLQYLLFNFKKNIPLSSPENPHFKFIDLFAGIDGFRIAMQNIGGKCIFSSEWDKQAQKTYEANFGEVPFGDITKEETKKFIPDGFDILCAGFPYQAFSIAGKRGGFEYTRGTLFFDVAEIVKRKQPKAVLLENVKGLVSHDRGKTLKTILNVLRNDLNYFVPDPKVLNARNFGVPQNRERIFIVAFRKDLGISNFNYPEPIDKKVVFKDVKEKNPVSVKYYTYQMCT